MDGEERPEKEPFLATNSKPVLFPEKPPAEVLAQLNEDEEDIPSEELAKSQKQPEPSMTTTENEPSSENAAIETEPPTEFLVPPSKTPPENVTKMPPEIKKTSEKESPKFISKSQIETNLKYNTPPWSGSPQNEDDFYFEVIKNGSICDKITLGAEYATLVIGRNKDCHIVAQHPSLSRYHCILQFKPKSNTWFCYDLDSTHGTILNKKRVPPRKFVQIEPGYVMKLGLSVRLYAFSGTPSVDDAEIVSGAEYKALKLKELQDKERRENGESLEDEDESEAGSDGCSWGQNIEEAKSSLVIDALKKKTDEENIDCSEPGFENLIRKNGSHASARAPKDPKKTLFGFFEREGLDPPEFEFEKGSSVKAKMHCKLVLPVESPDGQPVVAEGVVSGGKKEAQAVCMAEACALLDRFGVLRPDTLVRESTAVKRAKALAKDDYLSDGEDEYLDRTGDLTRKRGARMKRSRVLLSDHDGGLTSVDGDENDCDDWLADGKDVDGISRWQSKRTHSRESLQRDLSRVTAVLTSLEERLALSTLTDTACQASSVSTGSVIDALDLYMRSVATTGGGQAGDATTTSGFLDRTTRSRLKLRKTQLEEDRMKITRFLTIIDPSSAKDIIKPLTSEKNKSFPTATAPTSTAFAHIGKLPTKKPKLIIPPSKLPKLAGAADSDDSD